MAVVALGQRPAGEILAVEERGETGGRGGLGGGVEDEGKGERCGGDGFHAGTVTPPADERKGEVAHRP